MSVKGMIRRAITTSILFAILFWTTIIATNDEDTQAQPQAIISEAKLRWVMGVDEMCKFLETERLGRGDRCRSPEATQIKTIEISMDEVCAKEKEFENKAVPATETVDEKELEVMYLEIEIWYKDADTNTVIESKHIRALHKFLLMFAGCRIKYLYIYNTKMTQNKEELQKIREILQANPWINMPISMNELRFCWTNEAKPIHPFLLQVILQAMGDTGAPEEEAKGIWIYIAEHHVGQAIQLLGSLKCKKLETLSIEIKAKESLISEEPPVEGEVAIGPASDWTQAVQEWNYDVEKLAIFSITDKCSVILPAWLLRKPILELALNIYQYMHLDKNKIQSIRAPIFWVFIWGGIDQQSIERDTAQKNSERVTNEVVTDLCINHRKSTIELLQTEEEFIEYQRSCLAWAATQFPYLVKIQIGDMNKPDYIQTISRVVVEFNPRMRNLNFVTINKNMVFLSENEYLLLRTMPYLMRPKLWKAFASGQMEAQINKQLGLKEDQKRYIQLQANGLDRETEQFNCPICSRDFDKDDESSWIYVTWPCRHASCLDCMLANYKTCRAVRIEEGSEGIHESITKCMMHNEPLLEYWKICLRIEEMNKGAYSMTRSCIEEDSDGEAQVKDFLAGKEILVINY